MSRTLLYGFAAAALTLLVWPADRASAIMHGCTPPDGIDTLTIKMDLDGKATNASGGYCAAIQQAVMLIDRSSMSRDGKQAAKKALGNLQAKGSGGAKAGPVNWQLGGKCDTSGNCTFTGSIGGSF